MLSALFHLLLGLGGLWALVRSARRLAKGPPTGPPTGRRYDTERGHWHIGSRRARPPQSDDS